MEKCIFENMKLSRLLPVLLLAVNIPLKASQTEAPSTVPFLQMRCEHLPDLNLARAGHQLFVANGELIVVGGHTDGFIRTATAEYFSNGGWHTLKTLYPHDYSFSVRLPDGDFLIGGGCSEDFGVGQTFGVERYHPESRTFSAFPILDIKRSLATAAVLASGRIVVSGNWYADDAIGLSDGFGPFEIEQKSAQRRAVPHIFPFGKDEAVIFGSYTDTGTVRIPTVDRLDGSPFTPEVFEQWTPLADNYRANQAETCRAVDPESGRELYLFVANDAAGTSALLGFSDGTFFRILTDYEMPVRSPWGNISWGGNVLVDLRRGIALVFGYDEKGHAFLLSVDYLPVFRGEAAHLCVYYTEALPWIQYGPTALLPDGRFVLVGGYQPGDPMANYNPVASVYSFYPFTEDTAATGALPKWPFVLAALLLLSCAACLIGRRHTLPDTTADSVGNPHPQMPDGEQQREGELFTRITDLMEKEEWFRRKGLGVTDIATRLGSNTKYISTCINTQARCSFNEYLNGYRIRYAQHLLQEQPGLRLSEVSEAAGFTSESAFYRNFKVLTGRTPAEWLAEMLQK